MSVSTICAVPYSNAPEDSVVSNPGSSINHEVKFLVVFTPLHLRSYLYKIRLCNKMINWLFPFQCPRGLWMTPIIQ